MITLRANAFDAAGSGGSASVNVVDQSADVSIAVKEAISKASERLDVSEAEYHYLWRKRNRRKRKFLSS